MNGPAGGVAVEGVTKMPVALMDLLAAHQLKEALLVALWNRKRTQPTNEPTNQRTTRLTAEIVDISTSASAPAPATASG